jgi:hypothetical protein
VRTLRNVLSVATAAAGLWAQTADKPLTNGEIESMLTAGVPESTILLKIETAAALGLVDLDASSSALVGLKQKGATERVLNAVLWAEPLGASLKHRQKEDRAVPGLPSAGGPYFRGPSGWLTLKSFLLWPPLYSSRGFWSRSTHNFAVPLSGSHSELQIAEARPAFYVREPGSIPDWRVVRLTSRDNERLLRLVSSGDFFSTARFLQADVREVQVLRVAGNIFTLRPVMELKPGEYALCTAVSGGPNLKACYGFGIQP